MQKYCLSTLYNPDSKQSVSADVGVPPLQIVEYILRANVLELLISRTSAGLT